MQSAIQQLTRQHARVIEQMWKLIGAENVMMAALFCYAALRGDSCPRHGAPQDAADAAMCFFALMPDGVVHPDKRAEIDPWEFLQLWGADVDRALGLAAWCDEVELMRCLVARGATDLAGAMRKAAATGGLEAMEFVRHQGGRPDNWILEQPLLLAASNNQADAFSLIAEWLGGSSMRNDDDLCTVPQDWIHKAFQRAIVAGAEAVVVACHRRSPRTVRQLCHALELAAGSGRIGILRRLHAWGAVEFDRALHYAYVVVLDPECRIPLSSMPFAYQYEDPQYADVRSAEDRRQDVLKAMRLLLIWHTTAQEKPHHDRLLATAIALSPLRLGTWPALWLLEWAAPGKLPELKRLRLIERVSRSANRET